MTIIDNTKTTAVQSASFHPIICAGLPPGVVRSIQAAARPSVQVISVLDVAYAHCTLRTTTCSAVITCEKLIRVERDANLLRQIAREYPATRRVLFTAYTDLASIIGALHNQVIDRLLDESFTRERLLAAIMTTPALAAG